MIAEPEHRLRRWATWAIALTIAAALAVAAWHNVGNQDLWFDEAGQVWMAMGLGHWSDPLMPRGTLAAAMESNAKLNLDPGGYTVVVRLLTGIDTSATLLRGFSFVVFLGLCTGCGLLAWRLGGSAPLAIAACGLPLLSPLLFRHAFEIRAYGIEAACVVASATLLTWSHVPSRLVVAGFGTLAGLAIWSRYSAIVDLAPACLLMFIVGCRGRSWRETSVRMLLLTLPVLLSAAAVWWVTLRHQNPGGTPPDYIQPYLLAGASPTVALKIICGNLMGPPGIALLALLIALATCRNATMPDELRSQHASSTKIAWATVGTHALFVLLSTAGKHPWALTERWSIGLVAWSVACAVATLTLCWSGFSQVPVARRWILLSCAAVPVCLLPGKHPVLIAFAVMAASVLIGWASARSWPHWSRLAAKLAPLVLCAIFCACVASKARYDAWDGTSGLVSLIAKSGVIEQGTIVCDPNVTPCARFQFEFGSLKEWQAALYPQRIHLMKDWALDQTDGCIALITRRGPADVADLLGRDWAERWSHAADINCTHLFLLRGFAPP